MDCLAAEDEPPASERCSSEPCLGKRADVHISGKRPGSRTVARRGWWGDRAGVTSV